MDIKNKIMFINIYTNNWDKLCKYRECFKKLGWWTFPKENDDFNFSNDFAFSADYYRNIVNIRGNKCAVIVNFYYNMITFNLDSYNKPDIIYMDRSVPEYIRDYHLNEWVCRDFPKYRFYDNLNVIYLEQYLMRDIRFIYSQWIDENSKKERNNELYYQAKTALETYDETSYM